MHPEPILGILGVRQEHILDQASIHIRALCIHAHSHSRNFVLPVHLPACFCEVRANHGTMRTLSRILIPNSTLGIELSTTSYCATMLPLIQFNCKIKLSMAIIVIRSGEVKLCPSYQSLSFMITKQQGY